MNAFAPPYEPQTLKFERDRACWELAEHLRDRLNAQSSERPVVLGIADYNAWPNTFEAFPFLAVYRTGARGEALQYCQGAIAYYLPDMATAEEVPGLLRWVETRIARELSQYSLFPTGDADARHAHVTGDLRSEYGIGVLPGSEISAFPFFRILFEFEEIGV